LILGSERSPATRLLVFAPLRVIGFLVGPVIYGLLCLSSRWLFKSAPPVFRARRACYRGKMVIFVACISL
jgi:hypothetical protein